MKQRLCTLFYGNYAKLAYIYKKTLFTFDTQTHTYTILCMVKI